MMNLQQGWLFEATGWGLIEVSDVDRLNFLHNQSTNNFKVLKPGEQCDTVFVTSTARTIDLVTAYVLDEAVLLLTSPGIVQLLMQMLDRYIFFADKVKLADVTPNQTILRLIGNGCGAKLTALGITLPDASHQLGEIAGQSVRIAQGCGLGLPGYTLICDVAAKSAVIQALNLSMLAPMQWEQLRIQQGRPMPGAELTNDHNPLEAGLWQAISFNKGCYIGQETIARLDTYNGVKQQLWGFRSTQAISPGAIVYYNDEKVGQVTSVAKIDGGYEGLAYVKTKAGGAGLTVTIDGANTALQDLPYLTRAKSL
jgi:hypothetical protein